MSEELYSTELNNKKNHEYCIYCYENGAFKHPNLTIEQMIDVCIPFMKEKGMKKDEAIALMKNCLPNLKRWRKEDIITKVVEKDKMIIVGKEIRTTNKDDAFMAVIPKLWEEFENKNLGTKY
ncbi:zinc ribbon domain-containing protein [Clostridium botulinum]|nr:zinc ribbon domain-containing protein [Clostridium botulinum]MCS4524632.1 zinc ribbon domain-containing protein [Clostridium botulinum]